MAPLPQSGPGTGSDPDSVPNQVPRLVLRASPASEEGQVWLDFNDPVRVVQTSEHSEVVEVLREIEAATTTGLYAAGFVTYEAAAAFDPALTTRPAGRLPLAWFGLFRDVIHQSELPAASLPSTARLDWRPTVDLDDYRNAITLIRSSIEQGDSYQANFTLRLQTAFADDPWNLFAGLVTAQPVRYAAYVEFDGHAICSASPELFFSLDDSKITARPMKGTSRRGLTHAADQRLALALYDSAKNRAENLMIVDMLRNDLGRIASPGSVSVGSLFDLETYESVHQLTSTVTARTTRSIADIFSALFPCASITGAPKVRTMELLAELETTPRGIYTGTIGYLAPDRRAQFNVAIRTVHIDRQLEIAEYGTGGGIVWDSNAEDEYRECAAKALVLGLDRPRFDLLETILWEPGGGFFLLQRHLDRLENSADYFNFPFDRKETQEKILGTIGTDEQRSLRVRLRLSRDGSLHLDQGPLPDQADGGWRIALATSPIDIDNVFLYHKTTARDLYDRARGAAPEHDDVLLWNADGRLTESTLANLVFTADNRLFTPPVEDGLLTGTFREELIHRGELAIRPLHRHDLSQIEDLWLINSVRQRIRVDRIDELGTAGARTVWRNTLPPSS